MNLRLVPSKSTIFLIVDDGRLFIFIGNGFLDPFYFIFYFPIDFEGFAPFRAIKAKVTMQVNAMMSKLLQIEDVRMDTVVSSHRCFEKFTRCVKYFYLKLFLIFEKLIQIIIIKIFIARL